MRLMAAASSRFGIKTSLLGTRRARVGPAACFAGYPAPTGWCTPRLRRSRLRSAVVNALSIARRHRPARRRLTTCETPLLWEMSSIAVIILLAPALFAAVRRIRREPRWLVRIALVIAAIVVFSAVHIAGMVALRKLVLWMLGGSYDFHLSLATVLYEVRKDVGHLPVDRWRHVADRQPPGGRGGLRRRPPPRQRKRCRTWSGCATAPPASASNPARSSGSVRPGTMSSTASPMAAAIWSAERWRRPRLSLRYTNWHASTAPGWPISTA